MDITYPVVPGFQHSYKWNLHLNEAFTRTTDWIKVFSWDDDDTPFGPNFVPRCDIILSGFRADFPFSLAQAQPVPNYLCTNEDAEDWPRTA